MKYALAALTVLALGAAALVGTATVGTAQAATFVVEVGDHKMTVYSTATKKEACVLKNMFSYVVNGERFTRTQTCNVNVLPGKHLEVCKVEAEDLNQTKIEKPVEASCTDVK